MSPNKRIFLNIVATYGRTLLGVVCGIFSTRWVLMALGQEDFGLFGLVGSVVMFMSFFNTQFAGALSRFYAYSVGQARVAADAELALEECRKWFSTGVMIHTVVPMALTVVGYPLGAWAIAAGIVGVPEARIEACLWLWRFVCASTFVTMVNVPFSAMYTAKQYIAELTLYSVAQTIFRTVFIYYMTLRPGDWLVRYGLMMCLVAGIPQVIICLRASLIFPECRLCFKYLRLWTYMKQIGSYAWWQTFGGIGYLARHQFLTVIVNRFFGPRITASFSVGGTVGGEAAALTGAMQGAFAPAITTACGEGDWGRVRAMAYQACKFGTLLTLMFAIPMGLEIDELLHLWLKEVPLHAEGICLVMLAVIVVEKFSLGHTIGVNASGRIAKYQVFRGLSCLTAVPFSIVAALVFRHVYAVVLALLLTTCIACCSDVCLARHRIGLSVRYWLFHIIVPLLAVMTFSIAVGLLPRLLLPTSFLRMVVTTIFSLVSLLPFSWFFVLNELERAFVRTRIQTGLRRLKGNGCK